MKNRGNPNLKKGVSGNLNGRPKGIPNKKTKVLRDFLTEIADKGKAKLWAELKKLEGKDFVLAYLTMIEYVQPKLARVENEQVGDTVIHVVYTDGDLPTKTT